MILEIDDGFLNIDLSINVSARMGIETISYSAARGEHFIFANRALITKLESDINLSSVARGVFSQIRIEYSFIASVLKQLHYRVHIVPTPGKPAKKSSTEWILPIAHVAAKGLRPTVLLGENSFDSDVYAFAAQHYRIASKLKDVHLRISSRNGNGSGVSGELERISKAEEEFCLCITDSDRFCPTSGFGDIAAATEKIVKGSNWVITHQAPESRELENALPAQLIDEVALELGMSDEINSAIGSIGPDAALFADLKGGTSKYWIEKTVTDEQAKKYWNIKADKKFKGMVMRDCSAVPCSKDGCLCVVFPKVTKDLAKHVHALLENDSAHETYRRSKSSFNFEDWLRLGRNVLEAGAAPRPMRL